MTIGEAEVGRALAATGGRAVHDVVVRKRERVHEFERGRGVYDARVGAVAVRTDERAITEGGAEPLAAGGDERAQRLDRFGQPVVDRPPAGELGREEIVDPPLDPRRERDQRRRERRLLRTGRGHPRTVVAPGQPERNAPARARTVDLSDSLLGSAPSAILIIALGTIVLLFLMTGSLIVPLKADDTGARVSETAPDADAAPAAPDVRLTTDYPTAVNIALGRENAQIALARGRLRLGGDVEALVRRSDALGALNDATAALREATTYPSP